MEKLIYKYTNICNAAARLKESLDVFNTCQKGTVQYEMARDSVIQRFEFTFDTFWKFLRVYLIVKHGTTLELVGSKSIFKIALEGGILPAEQAPIYYAMIDDRNKTSHTYDSTLAQEIVLHIPQYWHSIDHILQKYNSIILENE